MRCNSNMVLSETMFYTNNISEQVSRYQSDSFD